MSRLDRARWSSPRALRAERHDAPWHRRGAARLEVDPHARIAPAVILAARNRPRLVAPAAAAVVEVCAVARVEIAAEYVRRFDLPPHATAAHLVLGERDLERAAPRVAERQQARAIDLRIRRVEIRSSEEHAELVLRAD